jgi:hypothetical protein
MPSLLMRRDGQGMFIWITIEVASSGAYKAKLKGVWGSREPSVLEARKRGYCIDNMIGMFRSVNGCQSVEDIQRPARNASSVFSKQDTQKRFPQSQEHHASALQAQMSGKARVVHWPQFNRRQVPHGYWNLRKQWEAADLR